MRMCAYCKAVEDKGHGPAHVNHCRDCHASWTGSAECHCAQCHRSFGGEVAFNAHQAEGICRDPATLMTRPKDGSDPQPRFRPIKRKHGWVWVKADKAGNAYRPDADEEGPGEGPADGKPSRVACTVGSGRVTVRVA